MLAGDLQDLMTAPQGQSESAYMDAMPLAAGPDGLQGTGPDAPFSEDAAAKYDAVMAYCLSKGQVLFTTLMTEFVSIHLGDLERYDLHSPGPRTLIAAGCTILHGVLGSGFCTLSFLMS